MPVDPAEFLHDVIDIAQRAGEAIMPYHRTKTVQKHFELKEDRSPVTKADFAANEIIVKALAAISDLPILSEESEIPDFETRRLWDAYWLVDPLDGTKDFIAGSGHFTVNIALIENHRPILGVIVLPMNKSCYYAHRGSASFEQLYDGTPRMLRIAKWDKQRSLNIVASRRHENDNKDVEHILLAGYQCDILRLGSSIKFCRVAQGVADVYPRFGPTSEWDTAAGQIILEQAGGKVIDLDGKVLRYNTKDSLLNPHFIAMGNFETLDTIWRKENG